MHQLIRKPALLTALAVAIAAGVLVAAWPREPRYEGKPLSYWLDYLPGNPWTSSQYRHTDTATLHAREIEARIAVHEIGPNCLHMLLTRIKASRPFPVRVKRWFYAHAVELDLIRDDSPGSSQLTYDATFAKRWQAMTAIIELGDTAKPLVPHLIALATTARDPEVREAAQGALRNVAPEEYLKFRSEAVMPIR